MASKAVPVLSKQARERLLSMLYAAAAPEILPKIDAVKRHLYELEPSPTPHRLVLDDLSDNEWRQRDVRTALDEIRGRVGEPFPALVMLRFASPVLLFTSTDFARLFPVNRERRFLLPRSLRAGLGMQCVKGRNPLNLSFTNNYYLLFPNYLQACLYYLETTGRVMNGMPVRLRFANPKTHLAFLASPYYERDIVSVPGTMPFGPRPRLDTVFVPGSAMASKIDLIQEQGTSEAPDCELVEPLFESLVSLASVAARQRMVLVRNLPFGLSKHTMPKILWNYDLVAENPVKTLAHDPLHEVHVQLLRFKTVQGAARFVRNFHGKKWDYSQHNRGEKRFYDPILCEIVD